ncbi:hypothetical protein [Bradyrhizobium sp.]|uniref:hypothetical protein n=1 Tax=Bradyrhizobium sp. TaxID=376 RepID=UPI003C5A1D59
MTELSEPRAEITEQPAFDAVAGSAQANLTQVNLGQAKKYALDFLFGAQRVMLEELVFASDELLDRARTETHLFTEFVSKMAGAHSVNNIKTMYEECGQHQIDFIRRDCERLFKHGQRMIETTSNLLRERLHS